MSLDEQVHVSGLTSSSHSPLVVVPGCARIETGTLELQYKRRGDLPSWVWEK